MKKTVMICDRCKSQYDSESTIRVNNKRDEKQFSPKNTSIAINYFSYPDNIINKDSKKEFNVDEFDLCPYCAKSLMEWLYSSKTYKVYNIEDIEREKD